MKKKVIIWITSFYEFCENAQYEASYYMAIENHSTIRAYFTVLIVIRIQNFSLSCICYFKGHKLHDKGHADLESGSIHLCCKRCGFSYPEKILY